VRKGKGVRCRTERNADLPSVPSTEPGYITARRGLADTSSLMRAGALDAREPS